MAQEKPDPSQLGDISRFRILLVEDSQFDRKLAVAALNNLGLTSVQIAETGPLAMGKIQNAIDVKKPFDLILLDAKLPGHDGIAILKWIRTHAKAKTTSVIMLTATANAPEVSEFVSLGISGYVVKPLKINVLKEKLHEALATIKKQTPQAG